MQRLQMYKLRADVTIEETNIIVARGLGKAPEGAFPDPRDPGRWAGGGPMTVEWARRRIGRRFAVAAGVPESGIELLPNDTYPLEACFERLNGVDFKKGCFVGQEVTARMKHKAKLRKGLRRVQVAGEAPVGTKILNGKGQAVGALHSQSGGLGLAYLRLDRVDDVMMAGDAAVRLREDG